MSEQGVSGFGTVGEMLKPIDQWHLPAGFLAKGGTMSETIYKLLDQNMESYGGCRWTLGEWKESEAVGEFCAPGGFHGYEHPLLAILHNPIHGGVQSPRLFVAEAEGIIREGQMKLKARRMRIVKEIPVPEITPTQRAAYAIHCAKAVSLDPRWLQWANRWLSGQDRTAEAAEAAVQAAYAEAEWAVGATWATEAARVVAAKEVTGAAVGAAMRAAYAAEVEAVAWGAAVAAREAAREAEAVELDLIACAEKAMEVR